MGARLRFEDKRSMTLFSLVGVVCLNLDIGASALGVGSSTNEVAGFAALCWAWEV